MRLLIVEDDPRLGPNLKQHLERANYAVDLVADGEDGLSLGLTVPYDCIILDVLLPSMDGFAVCKELRNQHRATPIILLTALGEVHHRITGLDTGADDYLVKPFVFQELEARIRALLRRDSLVKDPVLRFADIHLDTRTRVAQRGDRIIELTSKEYGLLEFLLRNPRQVLSRSMIAEHVWDYDAEHLSNVIDVYIRYIRRKLCEQGEPDVIQTIRGSGYVLKEPAT